jgi:hypothetical protein
MQNIGQSPAATTDTVIVINFTLKFKFGGERGYMPYIALSSVNYNLT